MENNEDFYTESNTREHTKRKLIKKKHDRCKNSSINENIV